MHEQEDVSIVSNCDQDTRKGTEILSFLQNEQK